MNPSTRKRWHRRPTVLDRIDVLSKEEIEQLIRDKIPIRFRRDGPHATQINGYSEGYIIKAETRGGKKFFRVRVKSGNYPFNLELSKEDLDIFGARISLYKNKSK